MSAQQVEAVFQTIRNKLMKATEQLPLIVGNAAVNYTLDAFAKQGFDGTPWQKRKSNKDAGRNLLVRSGRLKRSIRIVRMTADSVTIGSDVPYARLHNEGGEINRAARSETFTRNRFTRGAKAGKFKKGTKDGEGFTFKAFSYRMPKRKFIGRSVKFDNAMRTVVKQELEKALK